MNVVVVEKRKSMIIDDHGVGGVREVSMHRRGVSMAVVIVGGGEGGVLQILKRERVVLGVVRERPQLGLPPRAPHRLDHLPLLHVARDRHLLLVHVDLHCVHPCVSQAST